MKQVLPSHPFERFRKPLEIPYLDMDVVTSDIYIRHIKICYSAPQQLGMMKKPLASDCSSHSSLVARPSCSPGKLPQAQEYNTPHYIHTDRF